MNQPIEYPPIHCMAYSETGVGKSTFAATFPKNMLVFMFDSVGKDLPYQKDQTGRIIPSEVKQYPIMGQNGQINIRYRDVQHPDGIVRIEYFNHFEDVDNPDVIQEFRYRLAGLHHEYDTWQTIVTDSVSSMELAARKWEEKVMNPQDKFQKGTDTRQWFSGSTDTLEEFLVMRYAGLPMNVVILCHVEDKGILRSGELLRGPSAPGRLSKKGGLAKAYQEQYFLFPARDERGQVARYLQTQNDGTWAAGTQINAPDMSYPHYLSLWANYKG